MQEREPGHPESERSGGPTPGPAVPAPPGPHASPRREPLPSDLFAHSLGLSPANTPAPTGHHAAPDPAPPRAHRPRRPRRRGPLLAAAAVVVLAAGGTAVGFAVSGDGPTTPVAASGAPAASPSASPSPTSATGAAVAWLTQYVPAPREVLATGAQLTQALQAAGINATSVDVGDELALGAVVVRVDSSDAGADAVTGVQPSGRSLVPLARFVVGGDAVTVGQVVRGTPESVETARSAAADTAAAACAGLAANAAVTVTDAVAPVFEAGDLDVRASTLVAVVARTQRVEVVAAPQDPAEKAAGRPVRSLVLHVEDTDALRTAAAAARPPYLAMVEDAPAGPDVPEGSVLVTWLPNAVATLAPG